MRPAAVCSTQMAPAVISTLKRAALISPPNLSFLWLQNTEPQIVMNKIDIFTGSIKYSGAQQFNPFQVDSYCWVHSLRWGHLVIGTMNSIQMHPLQKGVLCDRTGRNGDLVEMFCRAFNLFVSVVKDIALGHGGLRLMKSIGWEYITSTHTNTAILKCVNGTPKHPNGGPDSIGPVSYARCVKSSGLHFLSRLTPDYIYTSLSVSFKFTWLNMHDLSRK